MNGQTDDRAQLVVGIAAALFGAIQKVVAGQPAAPVFIGAAHDILDVAGHHHTPDPQNPLRAAIAAAARVIPDTAEGFGDGDALVDQLDARGADGLTDWERASGFTAANVLGENINASETMDRTENTLPVADAASGEGSARDFALPAATEDRTVPGDYIPPDSQRPTDGDFALTAAQQAEQDAGRERFNLGELERDRKLREIEQGAEGGRIQEQDPADGGKVAETDPADGGKIQQDDQGADDAPQQ